MRKLLRCSSISVLTLCFKHTPFILNFSALHFTHSYLAKEGVPKTAFRHTLLLVISFQYDLFMQTIQHAEVLIQLRFATCANDYRGHTFFFQNTTQGIAREGFSTLRSLRAEGVKLLQ